MNQAQRLKLLQNTGKTVFGATFLRQLWEISEENFKVTVKRMVDNSLLLRLSKGVYALSEDYSPYELANTLVTPSYVSFNSALFYHGVSFQAASEISSAANFNYQREIDGRTYVYRKIKKSLLYNTDGLIIKPLLTIATIERAVADCLYIGVTPNLDNFDRLNAARLRAHAQKYPHRVQKQISTLLSYDQEKI